MRAISVVVLSCVVGLSLVASGALTSPALGAGPGKPGEIVLSAASPTATATGPTTGTEAPLKKIVLGMGFIPNVQFAPFYVADTKGYFRDEGLQVEFDYGMENDLLKLIGTGKLSFAIGSGDQVVLARAQDLPAVYVANFYRRFPVEVMSLKENGITTPKDLEGKKVGISCLCGASFVAWKALAFATGIEETKVDLQVIGYTQAATLDRGQVDAALDYVVNGPVQLRLENKEVSLISVSQYINLVSNGMITNEDTVRNDPAAVEGMVRAFLRGLRDTLASPSEALDITLTYLPEAGGENRPKTEAILKASIELWQGDGLGLTRREDWEASQAFMKRVGLIDHETDVAGMFTNEFVEKASQ